MLPKTFDGYIPKFKFWITQKITHFDPFLMGISLQLEYTPKVFIHPVLQSPIIYHRFHH